MARKALSESPQLQGPWGLLFVFFGLLGLVVFALLILAGFFPGLELFMAFFALGLWAVVLFFTFEFGFSLGLGQVLEVAPA
jgi:hypothetical protein